MFLLLQGLKFVKSSGCLHWH